MPAIAKPKGSASKYTKTAPRALPLDFAKDDYVIYPTHGVGQVIDIEEMEIEGALLKLFVICFVQEKMLLRVPIHKAKASGMRLLAAPEIVAAAGEALMQRSRSRKTMWSRRAHEYEAKINSGDLVAIAEVVRDLYRSEDKTDQSYSERQLYEAALQRYVREIAAIEGKDEATIVHRVETGMTRSSRQRRATAARKPRVVVDGDGLENAEMVVEVEAVEAAENAEMVVEVEAVETAENAEMVVEVEAVEAAETAENTDKAA